MLAKQAPRSARINGKKIGATGDADAPTAGSYLTWRRYVVPAGVLLPGGGAPNVVAVRVKSIGGAEALPTADHRSG